MSSENPPVQFEAVGGHKASMFYGETTRDGRTTLRKNTTAWEILYYLAMELAKDGDAAAAVTNKSGDETRGKFVQAAGKLAAFAPTLFSIRFPENFVAKSAALKPYAAAADEWVVMEAGAPARGAVLEPLFQELFDGAEQLQGFEDAFDTGIWGIGLVDETCGMRRPCVMDVKVGFIRHSPLTPADKVERMMKKERNSLMRDTALRICGCQRYIRGDPDGDSALSCERFGKEIGYAVVDVPQLSTCLKAFLSTGEPLGTPVGEEQVTFNAGVMSDLAGDDLAEMQQRIKAVRADVAALLQFFEETPDGAFMLQNLAFVSASVLLLYDAAATPVSAKLRFIDFARSSFREFNFDEPTVGFVQGLKNLDAYLA